jgi:hypothetical protein
LHLLASTIHTLLHVAAVEAAVAAGGGEVMPEMIFNLKLKGVSVAAAAAAACMPFCRAALMFCYWGLPCSVQPLTVHCTAHALPSCFAT